MKVQTTLEFILLLAAVASFSTVLLSIYAGFMHNQKHVLSSIGNATEPNTVTTNMSFSAPANSFYIAALVQNTTYVGIETTLQAALYVPEGDRVLVLELNASNAYVAQPLRNNISSGAIVKSFETVPLSDGIVSFNLTAIVNASGTIQHKSAYAFAYAMEPKVQQNLSAQYFASIGRSSESMNYSLIDRNDIYKINAWSHCSYASFSGSELSLGQECGSSANWYLWVGSWYCTWAQGSQSTTMTYCFGREPTGAATSRISANATYSYNISLYINADRLNATAHLASGYANANLTRAGIVYGNAIVSNVSGQPQELSTGYMVLNNSKTESMINASQYAPYSQALLSTESMLNYYNGNAASSSSLQYVLQSISSMNNQAEELSNTTGANPSGCNVLGDFASCAPVPYLYYTINAFVKNASAQNVDYEGSTINIS